MIKIIIGFIALLILLAASYIIFVDNNQKDQKEVNQVQENFQMPPPYDPPYNNRHHNQHQLQICQNFKNNPRGFIENNDNFLDNHFEPSDINQKMKGRYNSMYNQCYISRDNREDINNCNNIHIGPIPTNFTGDFAQKMINCISNDECDVLKTTNECVSKGSDCSRHTEEADCNRVNHCRFYNGSCQYKPYVCYAYGDSNSCNNDEYCNYDSNSEYCYQRNCMDNTTRELCETHDSCRWDGNYCVDNMDMTYCGDIPVDQCAANSNCVLIPTNEPRALCVPNSN